MTFEEIKKVVDQKPFRPFEIRLDDGTKLRFKERHGILISPHFFSVPDGQGDTRWIDFPAVLQAVYLDEIVEVY